MQCNAWGVIYNNDSRDIVQKFNNAYITCRNVYNRDVDEITTRLNNLCAENQEDIAKFNIWLKGFIATELMSHQQTYTKQMFDIANKWLKIEQDKLDNLRDQLYSPRIGIKNRNNSQSI